MEWLAFAKPPQTCPECRSKRVTLLTEVPAHNRTWTVVDGNLRHDFTESRGAAFDMTCDNCSHEWTSYKDVTPSPSLVKIIDKIELFGISMVENGGEPIKQSEPPTSGKVTVASLPHSSGGFRAMDVDANVGAVLLACKGFGADIPNLPWKLGSVPNPLALTRGKGLAGFPYALRFGPEGKLIGFCSHEVFGVNVVEPVDGLEDET